MHVSKPSRRGVVGLATLSFSLIFAALSLTSIPAGAQTAPATTTMGSTACPVLSVANPSPGDDLNAGGVIISGQAFDPAAAQGAGVSRVDLFLGLRDQGGTILGSAVPGAGGSDPRAFSVEVQVPDLNRGVDFAAYAVSSVTGQETVVTFPIFVGAPTKNGVATPTPIPIETTITSTCPNGTPSTVTTSAPAPAAVAAAPSMVAPSTAASVPSTATMRTGASCPVLSVANPSPGDDVLAGGLIISGTAFDPTATQGSGVQRVDLFLGQRDQGGTILGSAVPGETAAGNPHAFSIEVQVPKLNRGVDFAAYAIGDNGQQTIITFPVFVGVPTTNGVATPTPIPTTETVSSTCTP